MPAEVAVIAPDKELFDLVEELKSEICEPYLPVNAFLDEGVALAHELLSQGVKVLVSRGGTTNKLRNSAIPLPIIDIPITDFEVISLLHKARQISSKIAVIGFTDSLVQGAEVLAPILGLEVIKFYVNSEKEVEVKVQEAWEMGIQVVVGAKLAVEYAEKMGMIGVLLKSPKGVVLGALKEAFKVLDAIRNERELGVRLRTILDSIHEGIISLDKNGQIIHFNELADKVLTINRELVDGQSHLSIIAKSGMIDAFKKGEKRIGEIRDFNGIKYVCNLNPISINGENAGAIITFQELTQLQKLEQKARRNLYQKGHVANYYFGDIVSVDPLMERVITKARNYAQVDSTVLVQGESGTGKEMFVQSLHNASRRSSGPFVAVNCAVLPEHLLESELFGYAEGAFTGAKKGGKTGLFELAHGGTLFLDEIGEISATVQARLLRVLEERRIMRIGDDKVIPVDVRILCATNKSLRAMVRNKQFREDLFYRINILKLDLPPLRERKEDLPVLVEKFLEQFSLKFNKKSLSIPIEGMNLLKEYQWPGNIRELRNVVERLVIGSVNDKTSHQDIMDVLDDLSGFERSTVPHDCDNNGYSLIDQEEMKLILKVLEETKGNKAEAARKLGISKTTLWRKLKGVPTITKCNDIS